MKHLRRTLVLVALVVLLFGLVASASAQGQNGTDAPGVWGSSINLQNTGTDVANVTIYFYDNTGTAVENYTPTPLAVDGAVSIYVPALVQNLTPGQYSAVVSSNQPVLASVNTASTNSALSPWTSFAYDGFDSSQGADDLYFPGNYKDYYNFFSELVIQNTGSSTATLTATFTDASGTVIAADVALGTIEPNASMTYPTSAISVLPSGNTGGLFGATVSADQPIVGVANIWREQPTNGTASYSGFTGGSGTLYPPALYNDYYDFASALTIQNVGAVDAVGTVTYSDGTTDSFSLVPGAAQEFYQPANAALPSGDTDGVFAATVQTTAGEVVGLVSLSVPSGVRGDFASYNVPDAAATSVNIPNVNSDYYGFFSAVTVQNTGATATDVTITYATGATQTFTGVAAGGVVNIIHLDTAGDPLPNQTSTSATVTASNPLVAVIQHNTTTGVAGYDPTKVPSDFLLAVTGVSQ